MFSQNWTSSIVPIVDGRLTYVSDTDQNRIPDYSYAGYKNGEVDIPDISVEVALSPGAGDRTADIQAAIDQVEAMAPDADSIRGAVLLEAGKYLVEGTLTIEKSGVVLRGAGDGKNPAYNTILYRNDPNNDLTIIELGVNSSWDNNGNKIAGTEIDITTGFVQAGADSFDVADASTYSVGEHIVVYHPDSEDWLAAVEYGNTGTHDDADPWAHGEVEVKYDRYITAISGNTITIDAPVFMHLDKSLSQSYIYKVDDSALSLVKNSGVEKVRITVATNGPYKEDHAVDFIKLKGVENCWIGEITGLHFRRALVSCGRTTRTTIYNCKALEPHSKVTGSRRYNYFMGDAAQLILVKNNFSTRGRHDMTCGGSGRFASTNSGNVFHNNKVFNTYADSDNHVRWYQGTFHDMNEWIDPLTSDDVVLSFGNRGHWSGQAGYTSVFATAWNCKTNYEKFNVQGVPTGQNYAIGCHADTIGNFPLRSFMGVAPDAYIEGTNVAGIFPRSLYLAQLRQRLDPLHQLDKGTPETIPVSAINLYNGECEININEPLQLIASIVPADATNQSIQWEVENNAVLSVDNGVVTGLSDGTTIVRAKTAGGTIYDSTEITVVEGPVNEIVLIYGDNHSGSITSEGYGTVDSVAVEYLEKTGYNVSGVHVDNVHLEDAESKNVIIISSTVIGWKKNPSIFAWTYKPVLLSSPGQYNEFGLSASKAATGKDSLWVNIPDNTHEITTGLPAGNVETSIVTDDEHNAINYINDLYLPSINAPTLLATIASHNDGRPTWVLFNKGDSLNPDASDAEGFPEDGLAPGTRITLPAYERTFETATPEHVAIYLNSVDYAIDGQVSAERPIVRMDLDIDEVNLDAGENMDINPLIYPSNATGDIVYSSDNETTATFENGTITALNQGQTTVRLSSNGIEKTIVVNVSGSVDVKSTHNELSDIEIYPVPATETITIRSYNNTMQQIILFTMHGKAMKKITPDKTELNIDISGFKQGVYLIEIQYEYGHRIMHKIIKK